jgi:hypothetical protein
VWQRIRWYFGFGDPPAERDERARPVKAVLLGAVGGLLVATIVTAAAVVLLFGWDASELATGVPIGIAIWGAASYGFDIAPWMPSRELPAPPPGTHVDEHPGAGLWRRWLALSPLLVAFAWLGDRWELGAVFVPGPFAGMATAHLVGLLLVLRWERAHRSRLVATARFPDAGALYALPD